MPPTTAFDQLSLFEPTPLHGGRWPAGLVYQPEWLSRDEEATLIALIARLPLAHALYKGYVARRRVVAYGGRFDDDDDHLLPAIPLIDALHPLRDRVAAWVGVSAAALVHALVAEYAPGTPLGWHRDVPDFEDVVGVSLGSPAMLRFRPYPPAPDERARIVRLAAEPRSIYRMQGPARWQWQHAVAPVEALRWSVTFRTARVRR